MKKVLLFLLFLLIIAESDSLIVVGTVRDAVLKENYLAMVAGLNSKNGPFISIVSVDEIDSQKVIIILDKRGWEKFKRIADEADNSFQQAQKQRKGIIDSIIHVDLIEDELRKENTYLVIGIWFKEELEKASGIKGPYIAIVSINKIDSQKVVIILDKEKWEEFKKLVEQAEQLFQEIQTGTKESQRKVGEEKNSTRIAGGFSYKNVYFKDSGIGYIKVIGEMTNNSGLDYFLANFRISIYDENNNLLETGLIVISNFNNGQTKTFESYIYTDYRLDQMSKYKIDFDNGIEK